MGISEVHSQTIQSFEYFLHMLNPLDAAFYPDGTTWFFRGHGSTEYELVPSIQRLKGSISAALHFGVSA